MLDNGFGLSYKISKFVLSCELAFDAFDANWHLWLLNQRAKTYNMCHSLRWILKATKNSYQKNTI